MKPTKAAFYYHNLKTKLLLFLKNPRFILFYWGRLKKYSGLKDFDSFIISYPKSGRTWLQRMIIEAIKLDAKSDVDLEDISELNEYFPSFPKMLSTHASSSWEEVVHDEHSILKEDYPSYSHAKIIFLYRDPRDVLVSQYYHMKHRTGFSSLKKEDMYLNNNVGLKKIVHFMNKWKGYSETYDDNVLSISYEALKANPDKGLSDILSFLGIDISADVIAQAVKNTSLKKMQEKETEHKEAASPWSSTSSNNSNAFQSRKGIVGEYKEFFNAYEIDKINQLIANDLEASFNY